MRRWLSASLLVLSVLFASAIASTSGLRQPPSSVPPPGPPPDSAPAACSASQVRSWEWAAERQLGAAVADTREADRWIGPFANRKKASFLDAGEAGGRNWFPADVFRRTVCGSVTKFTLYDTAWTGAEDDFHIHVAPDPPFSYALDELRPVTSKDEIYGEITLPRAAQLFGPHFRLAAADSFRSAPVVSPTWPTGGNASHGACMYGPWVTEEWHDSQPEIHPSEAFWLRDEGTLHVFLARDASNRFQRERYFCPSDGLPVDCEARLPAAFRPWAASSARQTILIPYELSLGRPEARSLSIVMRRRNGGQPPDTASDAVRYAHAAGTSTLTFPRVTNAAAAGAYVYHVSERDCVAERGGRPVVLGYVAAAVGLDGSPGNEAFAHVEISGQMTDVSYTRPARRGSAATPVTPAIDLRSLRYERGTPRPRLTGTLAGQGDAARRQVLPLDDLSRVSFSGRFKPVDDDTGDRFEVDLQAYYESPDEDLASYLNAALAGSPAGPGDTAEARRERYARVFGNQFGFDVGVRAEFNGQALDVGPCRRGSPGEGRLVVCLEDLRRAGEFHMGDEVADIVIREGPGARGQLRLTAGLRDPFGSSFDVPALLLPIPWSAAALDPDGLLKTDVEAVVARAGLTADQHAALRRGRGETGYAAGAGQAASESPYVAPCDELARRARLFWLAARAFSRDLELDPRESGRLAKLLDQLKSARAPCAP